MGRMGRAVARGAVASEMKIIYHNRNRLTVEIEKELNAKYLTFDEILKTSDYLSLHMPLFEETTHIINKEALLNMKKGAFLINTARGSVIDEKALVEVLQSGHLAGVALDVYENEPNITPELLYMDNVLLSPHNGTATVDGRNDMTRYAVENIMRFFNGNEPLSRVV